MACRLARSHIFTLFSAVLLIFATVYLFKRSVLERAPDIDFRFIWTAGRLWAQGIDPYSPRFTAIGHALFPSGNDIAYWLYPPQWWVIARPLAALPVARALVIWRGINAALVLAAAMVLALAVRRARPATPLCVLLLLIAVAALMEGTAQTLLLGQTSILVFAGFALMAVALLTGRQSPMVIALVLLLLKPQFALPIIVCLAVTAKWRTAVAIAVAVTGVAALPQVAQYGMLPTISGLLGNMARHGLLPSNRPENLIGFSHLIWQLTGQNIANAWDIALDFVASGAVALMLRRPISDGDAAALAIGLIAAAIFFLPLHAYDTVALAPVAMLAVLLDGVPRYLAWGAVLVAFRPGIIAAQFGARDTGDLFALSLAGLFALIAAVIVGIRQQAVGSRDG